MIENIIRLHKLLKKSKIRFNKPEFTKFFQNYSFYHISKNNLLNEEEKRKIDQNIKDSPIIIFSQDKSLNRQTGQRYLFVGFEKTLIILDQSTTSTSFLHDIFSNNKKISVCFYSNTKKYVNQILKIKNHEIESDLIFEEEIQSFGTKCSLIPELGLIKTYSVISPCTIGYLIKKSYLQLKKNRMKQFINDIENNYSPETISEDEYVGNGSSFFCYLIYHIKREKLFVIKIPNSNNSEYKKLFEREIENYKKIRHPLLPKFYGRVKDKGYVVIEFINGITLKNINKLNLTFEDITKIIFQLLMIFKYFNDRGFIYRDLKPNNIMIDESKRIILIDFDQLIDMKNIEPNFEQTLDMNRDEFIAPEIYNGQRLQYSFKSDIYSLGKVIEYLINQTKTVINNRDFLQIEEIIRKCTDKIDINRPSISEIIHEFNAKFQFYIIYENVYTTYEEHFTIFDIINEMLEKNQKNRNDPYLQLNLGNLYFSGKYVTQNVNKAIYYFSLAANQNDADAQFSLGFIYGEGEYVTRDINKAIHYYSLAASQNDPEAQSSLGLIYYEGDYVKRDIDKAIHYFTLAANQNEPQALLYLGAIRCEGRNGTFSIYKTNNHFTHNKDQKNIVSHSLMWYISMSMNMLISYYTLLANENNVEAQLCLGFAYFEGGLITRDINKAIYYFSLAANQNDPRAQFCLGFIYSNGKYVTRKIDKAIHYYSLAANQNDPDAQNNLGRDINKAIHYYSLAANQNHSGAQNSLGVIYHQGLYVDRDINKAIHYFSLAANQNDPDAQNNLGAIYHQGLYVAPDINKAIHYFSLAANQNDPDAQNNLGAIYHQGLYIGRDINKAIHYYSLAANQNHSLAQLNLARIYYKGLYITRDVKKAIHYLLLSANKDNTNAQFKLGAIYNKGRYVKRDIQKAIHYFSLAANKNHPAAQLNLGVIYYNHGNSIQEIKKGRYYIMLASVNGNRKANFIHGFLLHEGKNIKQDILEAIHYYKEASSFNIHYAKNNLGIIYRHGFGEIIEKRLGSAIEYFEEAINQKNDYLSMYNLAHLYIYEESVKSDINKSIELLIKSAYQFSHSMILLCLLVVKQFGSDIDTIKTKLEKLIKNSDQANLVIQMIFELNFFDKLFFEMSYEIYRTKEFLYDFQFEEIELSDLQDHKSNEFNPNYSKAKDITSLFYDGFGIDLTIQ
ncbi:hypothetical protein M9Y10_007525 [Tritrichomonas musculus]|uniref:Protein kinase domain-containing protein n=1 Tax=Tritrichomonas musculus TaxID=1915356 RepID=A0ABR2J2I7_9EUKA